MLREAPRARGRAVLGVRELFSTLRSGNPIVGIATSSKADELRQYDEHASRSLQMAWFAVSGNAGASPVRTSIMRRSGRSV